MNQFNLLEFEYNRYPARRNQAWVIAPSPIWGHVIEFRNSIVTQALKATETVHHGYQWTALGMSCYFQEYNNKF